MENQYTRAEFEKNKTERIIALSQAIGSITSNGFAALPELTKAFNEARDSKYEEYTPEVRD